MSTLKERQGLHIFGKKKQEEWKVVGYSVDIEVLPYSNEAGKPAERHEVKQVYKGKFENRKGTRIETEINSEFFVHVQTIFNNPDINDRYPLRLEGNKQNHDNHIG